MIMAATLLLAVLLDCAGIEPDPARRTVKAGRPDDQKMIGFPDGGDSSSSMERPAIPHCGVGPVPTVRFARTHDTRVRTGHNTNCAQKQPSPYIHKVQHTVLSVHGLKGTLSGGILNKVRRGEYRCPLPTGLVYDEAGNVVLDPDSQIRETIAYFFETFSRVGSACQTVKVFRREGLGFPSRLRIGGTTVFRPLTAWTAQRVLSNPRYAGAYVYGRRRYRRAADGKKKVQRKREFGDWLACLPNAHPSYITWERYQQNLKLLAANGRGYELARASPPREGAALLQGRAVCGRCGRHFRVRYASRRGG